MDIRPEFLGLVLACALVTALPRVLPLVVLSRLRLPVWLVDWLGYVPIAVLSALLTLELYAVPSAAILPALLVAWLTRSLLATVAAGVAAFWLLGNLLTSSPRRRGPI
jgi:branched-subunit amino acid transport protein